jgi:hypothetical protein
MAKSLVQYQLVVAGELQSVLLSLMFDDEFAPAAEQIATGETHGRGPLGRGCRDTGTGLRRVIHHDENSNDSHFVLQWTPDGDRAPLAGAGGPARADILRGPAAAGECGEIGRRNRFRFCRRKAWGFESLHSHHAETDSRPDPDPATA